MLLTMLVLWTLGILLRFPKCIAQDSLACTSSDFNRKDEIAWIDAVFHGNGTLPAITKIGQFQCTLYKNMINVLVVVDVQNDYCTDCPGVDSNLNSKTGYGIKLSDMSYRVAKLMTELELSPAETHVILTQEILDPASSCAQADQERGWVKTSPLDSCERQHSAGKFVCDSEGVVFTADTLKTRVIPDAPSVGKLCRQYLECILNLCHVPLLTVGSNGSEVVSSIIDAVVETGKTPTYVTKQCDDWMGNTAKVTNDFGSLGLEKGQLLREALVEKVCQQVVTIDPVQYDCSNVNLIVSGIQTSRGVLKGALHAADTRMGGLIQEGRGFNVFVPTETTRGGGGSSDVEAWRGFTLDSSKKLYNAQLSEHSPYHAAVCVGDVPFVWNPAVDGVTKQSKWWELVYSTANAGPTLKESFDFMSAMGIWIGEADQLIEAVSLACSKGGGI